MKFIDERLMDYSIKHSTTPSIKCDDIQTHTKENVEMSQMLVGKLEGSLLGFFIRAIQAEHILEIVTFTGYSALAMAENLPANGQIITLDINPETSKIAHSFWGKSEHGKKITQILGPALDSLKSIDKQFDLIFIDADKINYQNYLDICLKKLSPKGIIVLDNMLWSGKVVKNDQDESTQILKRVNEWVKKQEDLYSTLLPVRDGMLLIKRTTSIS